MMNGDKASEEVGAGLGETLIGLEQTVTALWTDAWHCSTLATHQPDMYNEPSQTFDPEFENTFLRLFQI